MKYTIKSFINALIGGKKAYRRLLSEEAIKEVFLEWDGTEIIVFGSEKGDDTDSYSMDAISFCKYGKQFLLGLEARLSAQFTIEFSDGGLKRRKVYKVSDYIE